MTIKAVANLYGYTPAFAAFYTNTAPEIVSAFSQIQDAMTLDNTGQFFMSMTAGASGNAGTNVKLFLGSVEFQTTGAVSSPTIGNTQAGVRFYINKTGYPRTGVSVFGAQVTRKPAQGGWTSARLGHLAWVFGKPATGGSGIDEWIGLGATTEPTAYVEVVVDWDNHTASSYYNGTKITERVLVEGSVPFEVRIGSYAGYTSGGNPSGFSIHAGELLNISNIYYGHDETGTQNPTGRLGPISLRVMGSLSELPDPAGFTGDFTAARNIVVTDSYPPPMTSGIVQGETKTTASFMPPSVPVGDTVIGYATWVLHQRAVPTVSSALKLGIIGPDSEEVAAMYNSATGTACSGFVTPIPGAYDATKNTKITYQAVKGV